MAKLLVIDDDEFFVNVMTDALRAHGHEVEFALDGEAGEAVFATAAFDGVVCDLVMPNQEGLETIRSLRGRNPNLAIVAISSGLGSAQGFDVLSVAARFGAHVTLKKPFRPTQLVQAVEAALAMAASPAAGRARAGGA